MQYKQLGNSDLQISRIGFGCMSLLPEKEEESIQMIHRAMELGINFFDTADLYNKGMNEKLVGKAVKAKRDNAIIATKVGNQWRADGSGWDWNPRKDYILTAVEESLKRLQTEYIDLYQLHGGTIDDPINETIEAFELLEKQGKIRYYGISSIRPNVIREYVKRSSIISVMTQYGLADRRPEESILNLLQQKNIGVLSRGALAQGLLVNKPAKEYLGHSKEVIAAAAQLLQGIDVTTQTAAQNAILFVLHHPAITSAVVGMSRMEQLLEIAATADKKKLTTADIEMLQDVLPAKLYEQHR
ncbi:MAG TPA: aldo/keto reductase [Chitinophagaceae bacterium]|nr:aldo/keto reductase [Chitinophagaceae bacterium]